MKKKRLYIETYGCQMNFSDSEVVVSILSDKYDTCSDLLNADVVIMNTCSIRDHAEQRVLKRLDELNAIRKKQSFFKIGLIGCMADRFKEKLIKEKKVDFIAGPDAYRSLPVLLAEENENHVNVLLSTTETYDDIHPTRYDGNGISAFISIMRGCNNFCSYCVVPYTRGRERSRDPKTILAEAERLFLEGYREITVLGQNVNSYNWETSYHFPDLMKDLAEINPLLRLRFATSHPKDISDDLLKVMAHYKNICKSIHLPVQSGSNRVLEQMNRKYTREWYLERIEAIKHYMPEASISTDIIAGFCGETLQDHQDTLSLMKTVGFDFAYMFKYSSRSGTYAYKKLNDDVEEEEKVSRLEEIIALQRDLSHQSNQKDVGKEFEVLVEGVSKRSEDYLFGRNSQNKVIVFPKKDYKKGDYVKLKVNSCTAATLLGEPL